MFFKKYGDLIVSIFYLVLGVALIVGARALPKSKVMEIGPDFMPTVIGAIILILAALITPSDPFSMFVLSIPLYGLYEFSILMCKPESSSDQDDIDQ